MYVGRVEYPESTRTVRDYHPHNFCMICIIT